MPLNLRPSPVFYGYLPEENTHRDKHICRGTAELFWAFHSMLFLLIQADSKCIQLLEWYMNKQIHFTGKPFPLYFPSSVVSIKINEKLLKKFEAKSTSHIRPCPPHPITAVSVVYPLALCAKDSICDSLFWGSLLLCYPLASTQAPPCPWNLLIWPLQASLSSLLSYLCHTHWSGTDEIQWGFHASTHIKDTDFSTPFAWGMSEDNHPLFLYACVMGR